MKEKPIGDPSDLEALAGHFPKIASTTPIGVKLVPLEASVVVMCVIGRSPPF